MAVKLFLSTLLLVLALTLFDESVGSELNKLKTDLFEKYDKKKYPGGVTVQPDMIFQACPTLNSEGIMSHNVKEHYEWNDNRLQWNPADYDNIHHITVPLKDLWVPNIKLSAGSTVDDVEGLAEISDLVAEIRSVGVVRVDRFSHYRTRCFVSSDQVESSHVWNCDIKLGSMETYGSETFRMDESNCDTDLFSPMADQCRQVIYSRSTSFEELLQEDGPTRFWFVVKVETSQEVRILHGLLSEIFRAYSP